MSQDKLKSGKDGTSMETITEASFTNKESQLDMLKNWK